MKTTKGPQVVAVTGASGGIGRAAAIEFGRTGATVALIARGAAGLAGAARQVEQAGGKAITIKADVADAAAIETAVNRVEDQVGPIDVWVNVACTSVFAKFTDIASEEFRRVTEVTYLGYVYATMAVLPRMQRRGTGTIVHVGSALAYRGMPLQSAYCGAKHAIQGFHEALRAELLDDKSPVKVTMLQMPAVNTPQFSWVLSRLPKQAQPVPPIYEPEVAGRAVVFAAKHPRRREYWVGGSTVATLTGNTLFPGILDRSLGKSGFRSQQTKQNRDPNQPANLWEPADETQDFGTRGIFSYRSKNTSLQFLASRYRGTVFTAAVLGAGTGVLTWLRRSKTNRSAKH